MPSPTARLRQLRALARRQGHTIAREVIEGETRNWPDSEIEHRIQFRCAEWARNHAASLKQQELLELARTEAVYWQQMSIHGDTTIDLVLQAAVGSVAKAAALEAATAFAAA